MSVRNERERERLLKICMIDSSTAINVFRGITANVSTRKTYTSFSFERWVNRVTLSFIDANCNFIKQRLRSQY